MVYVLNQNGEPLMPCKPRKARVLLNDKKAKVVKKEPFTIQLMYGCAGYKQPITLGIDTGSKTVGLSACSEKQELYSGELSLRSDIVMLLSERKMYRRARRGRKTRYREARFLNRVGSKKAGWLPPSLTNKINSHLYIVDFLHKLMPITKIRVEVASFDIEQIKATAMVKESEWDKEEAERRFQNSRYYVLYRDNYLCQHCFGKSKDKILHVHHIESRKTGGNAPNNLITVCKTCHNKHHQKPIFSFKRGSGFQDATFMNILKSRIIKLLKEQYRDVEMTFGYITEYKRKKMELGKTHFNDAFCIANYLEAKKADHYFKVVKKRCHNRKIHRYKYSKGGFRKRNQSPFETKGFRLFDKVKFQGILCFIYGRRQRGSFEIRYLEGETVRADITYKKLKLVERQKVYLTQRIKI